MFGVANYLEYISQACWVWTRWIDEIVVIIDVCMTLFWYLTFWCEQVLDWFVLITCMLIWVAVEIWIGPIDSSWGLNVQKQVEEDLKDSFESLGVISKFCTISKKLCRLAWQVICSLDEIIIWKTWEHWSLDEPLSLGKSGLEGLVVGREMFFQSQILVARWDSFK